MSRFTSTRSSCLTMFQNAGPMGSWCKKTGAWSRSTLNISWCSWRTNRSGSSRLTSVSFTVLSFAVIVCRVSASVRDGPMRQDTEVRNDGEPVRRQ